MSALRILGIDPGTMVVGYACVEFVERPAEAAGGSDAPIARRASNVVRVTAAGGDARLIEAGALRLPRGAPLGDRLARLVGELEGWIERFAPQEVALEEAFCGKSAQAALRIGEARGVVLATAHRLGRCVHEYPPARIKRSVAGHGAASKEAVAMMAMRSLGLTRIEGPPDAGDAVAVALCRVEERRSPLRAAVADLDDRLQNAASRGRIRRSGGR